MMKKAIQSCLVGIIVTFIILLGGALGVKADAVAAPTAEFKQLTSVTNISTNADISQQVPLYPGKTNVNGSGTVVTSFPKSGISAANPALPLDTSNFYANFTRVNPTTKATEITPLTTMILIPFSSGGQITLPIPSANTPIPGFTYQPNDFGDTILDLYASTLNSQYTRVGSNINAPQNLPPKNFPQDVFTAPLSNINAINPKYQQGNYFVIYTHFNQTPITPAALPALLPGANSNVTVTNPNKAAQRLGPTLSNPTINGFPSNIALSSASLTLATNFLYESANSKAVADMTLVQPQATIPFNVLQTTPTVTDQFWQGKDYVIKGTLAQLGDSITASMNGNTLSQITPNSTDGTWTKVITNATVGNTITFTESESSSLVTPNSGAVADPMGTTSVTIPEPASLAFISTTGKIIQFYDASGNNTSGQQPVQSFDLRKINKNYVYGSTWNISLKNYTTNAPFSIWAQSTGLQNAGHKNIPLYYSNGNYNNTTGSNDNADLHNLNVLGVGVKIMSSQNSPDAPTNINTNNQGSGNAQISFSTTSSNFAGFVLRGSDILNNAVSGQTYTANVNLTLSNTP